MITFQLLSFQNVFGVLSSIRHGLESAWYGESILPQLWLLVESDSAPYRVRDFPIHILPFDSCGYEIEWCNASEFVTSYDWLLLLASRHMSVPV